LIEVGTAQFHTPTTVNVTYTSGRTQTYTGYTDLSPGIFFNSTGGYARAADFVFGLLSGNFNSAVHTAIASADVVRNSHQDVSGHAYGWYGPAFMSAQENHPQKSDFVPLPDLRKGIDALSRLGDCGQYIQSLINKVADRTGNPFVSDYIPDLFDTISKQGGVAFRAADPNRSETGGTVSGTIKGGDAMIIITPQPNDAFASARTLTPIGLRTTVYDYFIAAIHESIHLAGLNRRYTDRQLAVAAHDLNANSYLPKNDKDVSDNSDAWNAELKKHCPGPKGY